MPNGGPQPEIIRYMYYNGWLLLSSCRLDSPVTFSRWRPLIFGLYIGILSNCACRVRGEVKFQLREFPAALLDLNKALELQPDDICALK